MSKRKKRDSDDEALEVKLVRPYWKMLLGLAVCTGLGLFMLREADTNVRGLIINGIIHLDPGQADVFYAVMGSLCLVGSVLMLGNLYALLPGNPFRLRIADGEIRLPRWPLWKSGEAVALLDEVRGVELTHAGKTPLLVIVTPTERFSLPATYLPPEWTPTQVADRIIAEVKRATAPDPAPAP